MNHDPTRVPPIAGDQETASHHWLGIERKWWVMITLGIGGMAGALDLTVVNTVLPVIRESFGAEMSSIEWVVISYFNTLGAQSGELSVLLSLMLTGIGNGLFVSPNSSAIMGSAPRHRQGIAAGMVATARNPGMVLGVAISGAILSTQLALQTAATGDPREAFFEALRFTFLSIGFIAISAAITSLIRGAPPVAAQTETASVL